VESKDLAEHHSGASLLTLRRMGIDTYQEPVVYMRAECPVCLAEGFAAQSRVNVSTSTRTIIATLNVVHGDLLKLDEAGLSESAWQLLAPRDGEKAKVSHPRPLESFRSVRRKVYGAPLSAPEMLRIMEDIVARRYSDIHLAAFITACANGRLTTEEITALTRAMVSVGNRLTWEQKTIADKHCVGGLPGNRTTPILVSIAAAAGLCIPKTSSRAITSPSGTADAMETLAPVDLSLADMRNVVEREGGCIVWGGSVHLSPADDILIRVERVLDVDTEGQLVASVLSKKSAAGSTHLILDMPVGPTAKVRSAEAADRLLETLSSVAAALGIATRIIISDGTQPVGRGVGPALEAQDVLAVLQNRAGAPEDLREHALALASGLLEMTGAAAEGQGDATARRILANGQAWAKFQAICEAQGGMRQPPVAAQRSDVTATFTGTVTEIDNRRLSLIAKLAGAPKAKAAGVYLHAKLGTRVEKGQPLFAVHAETPGELDYALEYLKTQDDIVKVSSL